MGRGVMHLFRRIVIVFFAVIVACTIDDEDRCKKGFTWDPEVSGCRLDEEDTGGDTEQETDSNAEIDAGVDSGQDASPGDGPTGYGLDCTEGGGECAGFDADYCLADPGTGEGVCTLTDCEPGECPSGSLCCDCKTLAMPVLCLYDYVVDDIMGTLCTGCG